MMGQQSPPQAKLFYYGLCLEERIPPDHLLRQIRARVDFDFTYALVRKRYGRKGNVSGGIRGTATYFFVDAGRRGGVD